MTRAFAGNGRLWPCALAVAVTGTSLFTIACREVQPEAELPEESVIDVVELGRIGGRIYNEPDRVREILEAAGLTPEVFEEQVRAVTNDPALAQEYTRGFEAVRRPRPQAPLDLSPDSLGDSVPVNAAPDTTARRPPQGQHH